MRGSFAPEFLELPEEITVTAMRTHQKYLPVRGPAGLLPHFLAVMDNTEDRKGFIAKGSEWVLNARLADARFFFETDVQERLEARLPQLSRLTFQDKLGDYRQKTSRIQELAEEIARAGRPRGSRRGGAHGGAALQGGPDDARRQGVHGPAGRHGRHLRPPRAAIPDAVWKAIYDQYRPASAIRRSAARGLGRDPLARRPVRLARGLFRIGLVPTGSKDPYGLRRAALGVVAIAIARNWRMDWRPVARKALSLLPGGARAGRRRADARGARPLLRRADAQPARAARPHATTRSRRS